MEKIMSPMQARSAPRRKTPQGMGGWAREKEGEEVGAEERVDGNNDA